MGGRYWIWLGGRLLAAVVIVGWAASYMTPGRGEKEFQRALDALKQVRSVRIAEVGNPTPTQHSEFSAELVCAQDAYHSHWHIVSSDPDHPSDSDNDNIQVGYISYAHMPDGSWQKDRYPGRGGSAKTFCRQLAQGEDTTAFPPIATMIKRGILEKGDKKTVNGVRCREWQVTMRGGFSGLEHDTVCLGLDDHLPYETTVDYAHSRTTFSDYNSPFQIDLPQAALESTSANSGSN